MRPSISEGVRLVTVKSAESSAPERKETKQGRETNTADDDLLVPVHSASSSSAVVGPVSSDGPETGEEDLHDEDGAAIFDGVPGWGEGRKPRIAPEVPVPSEEMVRRHRASGHCPYRAWCSECVMGACNQPAHTSRPMGC